MPVRRSVFLVTAFAALLAICGGAAWAVWSNTRDAQATATQLAEQDWENDESLEVIRSSVYTIAILARDVLLGEFPNPDDSRKQFAAIRTRTDSALAALQRQITDAEMELALRQLGTEWGAYADSTEALLAGAPEQREDERRATLRRRMGRRQDILRLTERVEALAVKNSAEQRTSIAISNRSFRTSLGWIAGVALLLGAGVAGFTILRMRVLEQQSEDAEFELRSLSGQLRTTQEQERKYLSRELHDQVGQMLTGLRMELSAISRTKAAQDPEVVDALDRTKGTLEQTLQVVRNIAMLLRPSMLDDLGLTPALTWLTKEISRSSGIEIRRNIDARVDLLPDAHRTCLYRIVQEALTNVARHSGARGVDLNVTTRDGWVRVSVADDGRGFDPASKRKGLGLLGMEERVRELGGQFYVASVPGRGVTVEVHLPEPVASEASYDNSADSGRSRDRADGIKAAI